MSLGTTGLSPRLRGNLGHPIRAAVAPRFIPAPAGEPRVETTPMRSTRVYPRACGGTWDTFVADEQAPGLSPRLRGNHGRGSHRHAARRFIPAPAGEPSSAPSTGDLEIGLSPRLRGNRLPFADAVPALGFIPAPAGEPISFTRPSETAAVYPRACGGTKQFDLSVEVERGLSPRLRGNQGRQRPPRGRPGFIPAPAGEPAGDRGRAGAGAVYPRACGGTDGVVVSGRDDYGLSPRLRGNPVLQVVEEDRRGFIPAPAGEPRRPTDSDGRLWVYPRACGGTPPASCTNNSSGGLSPRLRGNLAEGPVVRACQRFIPAPAGEPLLAVLRGQRLSGLSPRLRGNLRNRLCLTRGPGFIPAPAGEPSRVGARSPSNRVYPRACGGTLDGPLPPLHVFGLSPRLRGNRP